jgi:hypothetical protein
VMEWKSWVQDQASPLYMAISNGQEENVMSLIEAGANVNVEYLVGGHNVSF